MENNLTSDNKTNELQAKKTVRTFAWASFFNDMGSDMIYPIWPLFITTFLGANMAVLGFLDGLGDALVSVSQAISGYWSDRIRKRKIFIWLGYGFGALSKIGYAFSSSWQHLIPFRIMDRAGKMRGAPRDATIADLSTEQNRGRHFGFLRAMDNLGAVMGIIVTILLFSTLGYKKIFYLAAIPSAIGTLLIIFMIKELKTSEKKIFKGWSFRNLSRDFKLYLVLSSLFALGSFSYSFLLIYAKQYGFSVGFIPILYLIFTAVASAFSLPFGRLADRIGRKAVMALAFAFWILVCLTFIFLQAHWAIILAFVIYGLHIAALQPVQKTFVSDLAPVAYRASSLGSFQMITGLCALPASWIAGILWDTINPTTPLIISMILTITAALILPLVKKNPHNQQTFLAK